VAKQLPRNTGQGNPPTTTIPGPSTPQQGQLPNDQQIQDSLSLLLSNPLYASLFSTEQKISALGVPGNKVVDKTDPSRVIRYEGFQAVSPQGANVQPKYYDNDQYILATYGPERQSQIISQLQKANYLTEKHKPGDPLTKPIAAFAALMTEANLTGQTWEQMLTFRQTQPISGGGGNLQSYRVTNPLDLRSVFRKAAQDTLGRGDVPQEQLDRMVNAYQQAERSYQQKAVAGGTVTQAPSPTTFAEQQIETQNPDEATAYKFAEYAQVFEKLLGA
jgi:hypothetical protein